MSKLEINPLRYPSPLSFHYVAGQQRALKHLGVSPSIDNGICYWRVLWRPFLKEPVHFKDKKGRLRVKKKCDSVRTERYPILAGESEEKLFDIAVMRACDVYRLPKRVSSVRPQVDWQMLAKATGQKLRNTLSKPSMASGVIEEAAYLFESGASNAMVASRFNVNRSTASRWRKKARELGLTGEFAKPT